MEKSAKSLLTVSAFCVAALVVYLLQSVLPPEDADGSLAFQRLSQEIRKHPDQNVYQLTRISNRRNHMIDVLMRELNWNEYKITYRRKGNSLTEIGVNLTQEWEHVTDEAIYAVAKEHGTYSDLAQHGCRDIHP